MDGLKKDQGVPNTNEKIYRKNWYLGETLHSGIGLEDSFKALLYSFVL